MSDINELPVNPQTPEINCLEGQGYADGCDEQDGEKIEEDDEMIIGLNEHNPVELSQLCNTSENDAQKSSSDINQQEVESANIMISVSPRVKATLKLLLLMLNINKLLCQRIQVTSVLQV